MTPAARSGLTLLSLVALVVAGGWWGWSALTKPFPKEEVVPVCVETQVPAGTDVRRDQVVVDVYNGSRRRGLAGSTMDLLTERGFVAGSTGNAPVQSRQVQIWTNEPANPAVQLVKQQFRGPRVVKRAPLGEGITIVMGDKFGSLRTKQVEFVLAKEDTTICRATGAD